MFFKEIINALRTSRLHRIAWENADLLARFKDHTVAIWQKHGIVPIGFWTTLIGRSTRELTYILVWNSLADREIKWAAFESDQEWLHVRDESEKADRSS